MSKRAGNLDRATAADREIIIDSYLIAESELCCFCKDLDCTGRGVKEECKEWPAHAARNGILNAA